MNLKDKNIIITGGATRIGAAIAEKLSGKNKEIVRKVIVPNEQKQTTLKKVDTGVQFYDKDPFWVKGIGEPGYTWRIK